MYVYIRTPKKRASFKILRGWRSERFADDVWHAAGRHADMQLTGML